MATASTGYLTHGRFPRKHDAVRAIQDGVGHIRGFRAGGAAVIGHGLQHLRSRDHGFAQQVCLVHQTFLDHGDLLDGYFHPQVPAGNHDAIRGREDCLHTIERPGAFNLGDEEWIATQGASGVTDGTQVRRALDKGLADRVHALFQGEFQAMGVVIGKGADAEINARQVKAFAGAQFAPRLEPGTGPRCPRILPLPAGSARH